jgi:nitroreductase
MTDFFEMLKTRRSIRDFEDRDVPLDLIRDMINDATFAPSASNNQCWRFIIINNRGMIRRISDDSKRNLLQAIEENPYGPGSMYESAMRDKDFNVFYNAPCLVIICGQRHVYSLDVDCALAACYFMFSATSRGLGTCWVNLGAHIKDPELKEEIGLTEDLRIVAPIILGYPKSIPPFRPRNKPEIIKIIS